MKLDDRLVARLLADGHSVIEVARLYGCSRQAVYDSKKRHEQCTKALVRLERKAKKASKLMKRMPGY